MRIARILTNTYAEGPGCRFCIWVQGCKHGCDGCFATDLWDYSGGTEVSVEQLKAKLRSVKESVCGITFLGGEPFDQAGELAEIAEYARACNMTIITFTGYTYAQLRAANDPQWTRLLQATDLLIDGRFEKELLDYSRPLVGSSNQQFIFLTDRIAESEIAAYKNRIEIRTAPTGRLYLNGMGNIQTLQKLMKKIEGAKHG